MQFGFYDFLNLFGALGFFIFGMKVMSDGIQKAAGSRMRQILSSMTKNRFLGVFTGFLITALVQSSSATTVMTVSFVNAGLLTLVESAGVMMGANIGTTVTAWLVSIFGFKVKIVSIALPIIAVGLPMLFAKRSNLKYWGEFLIGFALLFMGLDALKSTVPDLRNNPEVLAFLADYAHLGILSSILFVAVGTVLTVVIQSSSAAMALTITMCYQGWIPFEIAAPMVLGENIGTTITAELSSIVANVYAKRSARIHSLFNIIGVTWMLFAYPFYLKIINSAMVSMGMASPFESSESIPIALSYFHTAFNLSNVLLLIWFVPWLVKLATKSVRSKGEQDEEFHLKYIGRGLMNTPGLELLEARQELGNFGDMIENMGKRLRKLMDRDKPNKQYKQIEKIYNMETTSDTMEKEISNYILKISEGRLTEKTSIEIRSIFSICHDLERIADIFAKIAKEYERKIELNVEFKKMQIDGINSIQEKVEEALSVMALNLNNWGNELEIEKATSIEKEINTVRSQLRRGHLQNLEKQKYDYTSGLIYYNIFIYFERSADHIINVSDALNGQVS
ncbi:MAG: Na/Pi cotransporter family protein [Cyclobacteriaceae bacterium]|jgi:phosphate:Na+ symporter